MSDNNIITEGIVLPNKNCTAFCPECNSDLFYIDNECICKNKDCSWTCTDCKDNE